MDRNTKLRLLGGCILLFNLALIGSYSLQGLPVLLLTFGFAAGYEYLVVRRAAFPRNDVSTDSTDDQSFYDQAIAEIRGRSVVRAVWARAFADAGGDQKRTMALYITLRVAQLKAERQVSSGKPSGKMPSWQWALLLAGMYLLVKLIGPLPGVLTILCYVLLRRKLNTATAFAGAAIAGLCLIAVVSLALPKDMQLRDNAARPPKPWELSWEDGAVVPPPASAPANSVTPPEQTEMVPLSQPVVRDPLPPQGQLDAHYAVIYAAHPDADQIVVSSPFIQWLSSQPAYQQAMQKGTADQVIAVFSAFKARSPKGQ